MATTTQSSSSASAPVMEIPKATVYPSDPDFLIDEKNIEHYENVICAFDRKDQNANKGWHVEWYGKTADGGKNTKVEFKLEGLYTRFGVGYAGEVDEKKYGGKLIPQVPKSESKDEKEKVNDPGFCIACPEKNNQHILAWINCWNRIAPREFSLHSMIYKGKKMGIESATDACVKVSKPSESKINAEKYGNSFKFKVDRNTNCLKKSACGKYDLPCKMADLWKQEGTYTIFGTVYKINLDVRGGHAMSFLATTIILSPKVVGLGKAAKHVNLPPSGFVDGATTPVVPPTLPTPSPSAPAPPSPSPTPDSGPPASSVSSDARPEDDDIMGVAGVSGKRKFIE